jgi:hypothetical protein
MTKKNNVIFDSGIEPINIEIFSLISYHPLYHIETEVRPKYFVKKKTIAFAIITEKIYHAAPVIILHQFLWVSRKFEIAVSFVKILVRILSWDFFPSYFFYSFYQILIRRWDVDLHAKFQPNNIFFVRRYSMFSVLEKTVSE